MPDRRRFAFIGNSLPRRCGIATFTTHLADAVAGSAGTPETLIVAMNDHGGPYDYPPTVGFTIDDTCRPDYSRAADWINAGGFDAVSLQHEYGIFGGDAGDYLLDLLERLTVPLVTTLHTILAEPSPSQRRVMDAIIAQSSKLVVMSEKGREMLIATHKVDPARVAVIQHGIPDFAFVEPDAAKARLGFAGHPVALTFGLLAPNKGIETMIDAMPAILEARPDALYVVLGATHPNLVRAEGELYRERLRDRAIYLGVENNVRFVDGFVDQDTLLDYISACDVYVTPYLNEAQMTSGTLSYSFGLGKPVVSTPYWHATELLRDDAGVIVPFGDSAAIGDAVARLLTDDAYRNAMRRRAYEASRPTIWSAVGERYADLFIAARTRQPLRVVPKPDAAVRARAIEGVPAISLDYFMAMCDDTGLFQHAIHSVPDRNHGYCIDDNARALILACQLAGSAPAMPDLLTTRFASFIQHAWNPSNGWFRNFMAFDRRWLETQGSEDSHARTLWALGEAAVGDTSASRRTWAVELFAAASGTIEVATSPRAWAFAILGLDLYLRARPDDNAAAALLRTLGGRLMQRFKDSASSDWRWFESGLAYDNARLPQALLLAGEATGEKRWTDTALDALGWLVEVQTAKAGHFRPVGSDTFGYHRVAPSPFDQQPLEATATISACLAAQRVTGDPVWRTEAERAFDWFLGRNDLSLPLVDIDSGSCRDGLHHDRVNENRGAPSPFDQQPLEATATISACLAAQRVTGDPVWRTEAERAFDWFLGRNDLSLPLVDIDSGSCRDGLHHDRVNENRGAESVLAWLMSAAEMRAATKASKWPKVASLVA